MYIQPQFIDTLKSIWRHQNHLKCFWEEMMTAAITDRWHLHSWGQAAQIRQFVHCCYNHCCCSASWGVLLETEIIKMFQTHIIHLQFSSSLFWCAFYLHCEHDDLSHFLLLSVGKSEPTMRTWRDFDFCWTQKVISFKSKGSLLILRLQSHPGYATQGLY